MISTAAARSAAVIAVAVQLDHDAGVPCAPVNTIPEVLRDPQVEALEILQEIPGTGVKLTGLPVSFDGIRPKIRTLGPHLGQDNDKRLKTRK